MSLERSIFKGLTWSAISHAFNLLNNFIIFIILARILGPHEFGLVGMIFIFSDFAILFNSVGLGEALIQKKDITEEHLSSVFWINLFVGIFLCLLFIGLAPIISRFYNEKELLPLTILVSFNFLIMSVKSVQKALLLKNLEFKKIAKIDISSELISGIAAIVLALLNFGAYSLVLRVLIFSLLTVIQLWFITEWRPKLIFNFEKTKNLLKFGTNLAISKVINYWIRNIDNLLIGKILGTIPLGLYTRAYGLMMFPIRNTTNILNQVMFPAISNINNDLQKVQTLFLKATRLIALIGFPLVTAIIALAEPIINVIYGPKWIEVIPIIQLLAISGLLWILSMSFKWIYMSQGKADIMMYWQIIEGIVLIISIFIGIKWSLKGVAIALIIANYFVLWYPTWHIPSKLINLSFYRMLRNILPFFVCTLPYFLIQLILHIVLDKFIGSILQLLIILPVSLFIYYLALRIIVPLDLKEFIELINRYLFKKNAEKNNNNRLRVT